MLVTVGLSGTGCLHFKKNLMVEQKIDLRTKYHDSNESTSCCAQRMIAGLGASQVTPYVALLQVRPAGLA